MLRSILYFFYTWILLPVLYLLANIVAAFIPSLRGAVFGRRKTIPALRQYIQSLAIDDGRPRVVIHAASMGEFEHIKPLIRRLAGIYNARVIITFFSPSGFEHVKQFPGVDLFVYAPFDFPGVWQRFYKILKPALLIISKHDAWPNQVFKARQTGIPVILVNASLSAKSARISPAARFFLTPVYQKMNKIFAIATADTERLQKEFGLKNVEVCGDTKFDQALIRKEQTPEPSLVPEDWVKNRRVIIFGSIWPQGAAVVLPDINNLLNEFPDLRLIIAPHVPNAENFKTISAYFTKFAPTLFTSGRIETDTRVIYIDTIGVLADLYRYAHVAYVGGGFRQGIHNVMEAAVYGLPVIFGPVNQNASEAAALAASGGGYIIENSAAFSRLVRSFLKNNNLRKTAGLKAAAFASQNTGATDHILKDPLVKNALLPRERT